MFYKTFKNRQDFDELFEEYLSDCFDKSVLSFFLFDAKHNKASGNVIENLHDIDRFETNCFIDIKTDVGMRIASYLGFEKVLFLKPKSRPTSQQTYKVSRGKYIRDSKASIAISGEIAKIVIFKNESKVTGLKITLRTGQEFSTRKDLGQTQEIPEIFQIAKGQWISNAQVATNANAEITHLKFYASNQDLDFENLLIDPEDQVLPYHMSGLVIQLDDIQELIGIQFVFDYFWPSLDFVSAKIGLPKKCTHRSNWS